MKNRYNFCQQKHSHFLTSLSSATKWLSSTAIRLFSSSTDEIDIEGDSENIMKETIIIPPIKRNRGRPRKDPNAPKKPRFFPERNELVRRRLSVHTRSGEVPDEFKPNDGETRFLLTFKSLPKNLELIAKNLHPPAHNKYEEHRLACKLLNEEHASEQKEIFIPTFRKLPQSRTIREVEKGLKEQVNCFYSQQFLIIMSLGIYE